MTSNSHLMCSIAISKLPENFDVEGCKFCPCPFHPLHCCLLSKYILDIVRMACTIEPPPEALCRLPSCNIILDAIALNLPLKSPNGTNVVNITRWFSKALPNADISCIRHLAITSDAVLLKL